MAKITKLYTTKKTEDDSGMGEYRKKLFLHRAGLWGKLLIGAAVVLCVIIALRIWYVRRTYTSYEVVSSSEHTTTVDTEYAQFGGYVLKYSRDGVSCLTGSNEALWSQTYNMQSPIVDINDDEVIIADKSGNEAYVFDKDGLQASISTLMPISQVSVSSTGVSAILQSDGSSSYIYLYDSEGTELAEIKCSIDETGQPLYISISPDGARLAVSYLQVQNGQAESCLVFYNFGSVGSNYVDKIVSSKVYSGEIIPRVEYMTDSLCVAISDQQIIYFEGDEIPEEAETVEIGPEILSVFFGDDRIGIIVDGEEAAEISSESVETTVTVTGTEDSDEDVTEEDADEAEEETEEEAEGSADTDSAASSGVTEEASKYEVWIYSDEGRKIRTLETDLDYTQALFSGKTVILYGDTECEIYSGYGVLKYSGSLDSTINCMYRLSGLQRYVVVYADSTDTIKLQ